MSYILFNFFIGIIVGTTAQLQHWPFHALLRFSRLFIQVVELLQRQARPTQHL